MFLHSSCERKLFTLLLLSRSTVRVWNLVSMTIVGDSNIDEVCTKSQVQSVQKKKKYKQYFPTTLLFQIRSCSYCMVTWTLTLLLYGRFILFIVLCDINVFVNKILVLINTELLPGWFIHWFCVSFSATQDSSWSDIWARLANIENYVCVFLFFLVST